MTKAWCFWCESGDMFPKTGYAWIHPSCWNKLHGFILDYEMVHKKLKEGEDLHSIAAFLKQMQEFRASAERFDQVLVQWRATGNIPIENLVKEGGLMG